MHKCTRAQEHKSEDRGQGTEGRDERTEVRGQRREERGQGMEIFIQFLLPYPLFSIRYSLTSHLSSLSSIRYLLFAICYSLFAICCPLHAAPHISGRRIPGQPVDGVSQRAQEAQRLRALGYAPEKIQKAIGAVGVQRIAVVFMNFPSAGTTTSGSPTIQNYTNIIGYIAAMRRFYKEVSYNTLDLQFSYFPSTFPVPSAFMADNAMEFYGDPERGDVLIREAITKAGINKLNFDGVMVARAGLGNESTTNNGDIHSAFYVWSPAVNGFTEGFLVPEFQRNASPFGVYCHEMGHQLGLPDLYATDGRKMPSQVGVWCLMDMGTWANNGTNPSHPSAWCKQLLGWVAPLEVTTGNHSINVVSNSSDVIRIPIPTADNPANEYFLVEYRRSDASFYDKGLPGSGVLIWHINDSIGTIANNDVNNYAIKRVDLEEADNSDPSANYGDSTDPWPGQKGVFASPQSDAYNGKLSGITVGGFELFTLYASFSIDRILAAPTLALLKSVNYPNPAGRNYFHPRPGVMTTINFQMTRPPTSLNLAIYNISGDRIKNIEKNSLSVRMSAAGGSTDNKWVYEYDWDGRDESHSPVAPGIYLYRIRADGQVKVGKMVVER